MRVQIVVRCPCGKALLANYARRALLDGTMQALRCTTCITSLEVSVAESHDVPVEMVKVRGVPRAKPPEQTARQLLNWVATVRPQFRLNTGDHPISVTVGATVGYPGHATAVTRDTRDVVDALARARRMWIKARRRERADHRKGVWPHLQPGCCEWSR